ncbi:lipoprotein [Streptomyces sp. NRRL B-1347]|uniref:lipoprotein n=1 Tax=Streptomyces sp. NRRL B-1347 TaxID=1476877 RepID=UPI000568109A|nr:lipoprotein [Streptomyces sp. NRRL B-1347]
MSLKSARAATGVCAAAALALLVPACSSDNGNDDKKDKTSDLSAQEISDKAKKELLDATSVHITLEEKGTDADKDDPAAMDLTLDRDGNCTGKLTFAAGGGTADLVKRGDKVWMKPDSAFWRNQVPGGDGAAAAELFKNRYIHGSTSDPLLKGLSEVCDLKKLQDSVDEDSDDDTDKLKKGDATTVDGTKVVPLTSAEDGKEKTLYVASEGKPYLIRATEKGDGEDKTTTLSDYGQPVPTETPSAADSVDIGKLQEQLQKT